MAVMDQNCGVDGLKNLLVLGRPVMTEVVRSNTNATAILIAEKMAYRIRGHED